MSWSVGAQRPEGFGQRSTWFPSGMSCWSCWTASCQFPISWQGPVFASPGPDDGQEYHLPRAHPSADGAPPYVGEYHPLMARQTTEQSGLIVGSPVWDLGES